MVDPSDLGGVWQQGELADLLRIMVQKVDSRPRPSEAQQLIDRAMRVCLAEGETEVGICLAVASACRRHGWQAILCEKSLIIYGALIEADRPDGR